MAKLSRGKVYREGGSMLGPEDRVAVKYVTVVGWSNDFSVYMGESSQSDEEIAMRGDKVSEEVARAVAPYCSHLSYRL